MRRLLRWTFHALAAASLLLCMTTAALWVRSYLAFDEFTALRHEASDYGEMFGVPHYECFVASSRGRFGVRIGWSERPEDRPTPPWEFVIDQWDVGSPPDWTIYTFGAAIYTWGTDRVVDEGYAFNSWTFGVADWLIVCAFAVLPGIAAFHQVRAVRSRRRSRLGLCPACGYDLRASPERCPECGREDDRVTR